jgi:hypothetical protein
VKVPPRHPREAERLEALRLYRVLNTEAEKSFDDLARLASAICGSPLITPDGLPLGTPCVFDRVPRNLKIEQVQALEVLRDAVVAQLELRRRLLELADLAAERDAEPQALVATPAACPSCGHASG